MKKKLLYGGIAVLLIGAVIFAYIQMSGNPIEKNKAKESLEAYLEENYPDMDYKIKQSADYGWSDATFRFTVVEQDSAAVETTYKIYVSAMEPYEILGDTIHFSKIDKEASSKLNAQAEEHILTLLQKKVPEVESVSTDVEVYHDGADKWTPELETPKPMLIMLEIEKAELTKDQMLQQSKTIQQELNGESINYYMAEVGYRSVVDGEEIYDYVSFAPDQKLTLKDVNESR